MDEDKTVEVTYKAIAWAYGVTKGDGQTFTKGSGKTLQFTCDGVYGSFVDLYVDDTKVDSSKYSAVSGSTIVTLKNAYLESLSTGAHTIQFAYTNNGFSNKAKFTVAKVQNGNTGGNSGIQRIRLRFQIPQIPAKHIRMRKEY